MTRADLQDWNWLKGAERYMINKIPDARQAAGTFVNTCQDTWSCGAGDLARMLKMPAKSARGKVTRRSVLACRLCLGLGYI